MRNKKILKLTQCALIAALAYIVFMYLRIDIPVGTERTSFHLGNALVVIGALLLGGGWIYLLSCSIGLPMTFFGTATGSVASAMNSALTAVARLPFASISIPTLEWWHIAGLYVWLILFVAVLRRPGYRLMQGLLAMTALLVIGFTLTFC